MTAYHYRDHLTISFGRLLRKHRERRGLNRTELARRLGVTPGYVSALEKGYYRPSLKMMDRIADFFAEVHDEFFNHRLAEVVMKSGRPTKAEVEERPGQGFVKCTECGRWVWTQGCGQKQEGSDGASG